MKKLKITRPKEKEKYYGESYIKISLINLHICLCDKP
jgi:hypothetical protein